MASTAEAAFLWHDVDSPPVNPPVQSRAQMLPLGDLSWENFERLCYRLSARSGNIEDVRLYGVKGQAQEGIDLYVRRASGEYETWQCKRYQEVSKKVLADAVTTFLEGDWAARSSEFRIAVSASLIDTALAEEVEVQRGRCSARKIAFVPLDTNRLSDLLKLQADLVDDFFGREWVVAFNGPEAAAALSGRKLTMPQSLQARRFLHDLYSSHFQVLDPGIPAAAPAFRDAIKRISISERYIEPSVELVESVVEPDANPPTAKSEPNGEPAAPGFRRRDVRVRMPLSAVFTGNERLLLTGGAGYGKSAAMRIVTLDLLSNQPRMAALAKNWGSRLPLLLPFNYLTGHYRDAEEPSVEQCLQRFLRSLGATDQVLALLTEMISDERLLLLVDGLDEWQNQEVAVTALTALVSFSDSRHLPLVATGRPAGFDRIRTLGPEWRRAELLPLDGEQQGRFVRQWLRHYHEAGGISDPATLEQSVRRDVELFSGELADDPALAELGTVPLLLSAMVYLHLTGRVLPHSRIEALGELVKALIEDQPGRRAQAAMQKDDQSSRRSPWVRQGLAFLAYCIHAEPNSRALTVERASELLRGFFREELELTVSEAEGWTGRVMDLGRHDFGVLVPVQQDHVGFLHRAFQEFLAAQHLARQPLERLMNYCREQGPQRSWHEVTVFLFQMLSRADEVDKLVDLLRSEVADPLERPIQQILLTRLASSPINCTRRKAREVMAEAFGWIERGEWMPLRGSLVREAVHGLESAHVREMVAERMMRWFPGRLAFWHDFPKHSARKPNDGTVDDLLVALHNADSPFEYRIIAEGLALLRERSATLLDELRRVIRGPGEPGLAAAALHAFASGWPELPELGAMLLEGSVSPAEEIRRVAFLTRFNRGDRTVAVRDGLVSFCRDNAHLWPWEDDIIFALSTGWPKEPELMQAALGSFGQYGPGRWSPMLAIKYLLAGCAGEESVAQLVVAQLGLAENDRRDIQIFEERAALLLNYTRHPLVGPAAEAWLDRNAGSNHRPIEVAVCAQLAGTDKARQHLLDWLRRGDGMPAWIISTLQEMSVPDDAEVRAVLQAYMSDKQRRSGAVRFLPAAIASREELLLTLREILRDGDFWPWHDALELLVSLEGRDAPGLWESVEQRLKNDKGGHYWRLGHSLVIKIWPEHPLVRQLVIEHIYGEDVFISHFLEPYADDAEIRPLLDAVLRVLHPRLRGELVRALAPLARRGLPTAMAILAGFKNEPKDEARTIAARAFAKGRRRTGDRLAELADTLAKELGEWNFSHAERRQAAIAGLLELGRTDLIAAAREDGKKLRFETHASGGHNWEFIAAVVDHWEELAASMSDIWDRFGNSPAVAAELVNAGKIAAAAVQTASYEDQLRNGAQLDEDSVRALIALHGRSLFLRDLFLARFNRFMPTGGVNSIMTMEMQSYHLIGKYLAENFHGDPLVHDAMVQVANSILIHDAGWIALCRGWPNSPLFGPVVARLPTLIDAQEPVTAWIFSTKADAQQMAKYLLHYPSKLKRDHFGRPREGFAAIATRLQSDELCRQATFDGLKALSDIDVLVGVARLLGPTMRHDSEFRKWVLGQLQEARSKTSLLAPLALDILTNEHKTVECCLLDTVLTR